MVLFLFRVFMIAAWIRIYLSCWMFFVTFFSSLTVESKLTRLYCELYCQSNLYFPAYVSALSMGICSIKPCTKVFYRVKFIIKSSSLIV